MESRGFYNEILTEHNLRPEFKHDLPDADIVLEGVNPSCGDDIWLKLKVENDEIVDGAFVGDGCAISRRLCDFAGIGGHYARHDHRKDEGRGTAPGKSVSAHDQRRSIRRGD